MDVDGVIFHGRVEHLLHLAVQTVNLIHEQEIPSARLVRIAAISPGLAIAGPEVTFMCTPISLAIMPASVVFPSPGGP